jgi:hypothetical protein
MQITHRTSGGTRFAGQYGPITGVLVKLLSPAGQVPLHAHPTRGWAHPGMTSTA